MPGRLVLDCPDRDRGICGSGALATWSEFVWRHCWFGGLLCTCTPVQAGRICGVGFRFRAHLDFHPPGLSPKAKLGTAEKVDGRTARQVLANLSVAAACAGWYRHSGRENAVFLLAASAAFRKRRRTPCRAKSARLEAPRRD